MTLLLYSNLKSIIDYTKTKCSFEEKKIIVLHKLIFKPKCEEDLKKISGYGVIQPTVYYVFLSSRVYS